MKAFVIAMVVMVVVSLGAGYGLDAIWGTSADQAFSTPNTRL